MTSSAWMKLKKSLRNANQWFWQTPERALDQAYEAALAIKAIEEEHFNGNKIAAESANYGESVQSYFDAELKKYLKLIQMRLVEFKASRSVLSLPDQVAGNPKNGNGPHLSNNSYGPDPKEDNSIIFEKLEFIDSVVAKYTRFKSTSKSSTAIVPVANPSTSLTSLNQTALSYNSEQPQNFTGNPANAVDTSSTDVSVLPRSLLGTLNRITRELDPEAEQEVIKNFRKSKLKTVVSIRFLLLLILIPLLTQQLSKNFVIGPVIDHFRKDTETPIFLNKNLEEEALMELQHYEERLNFETFIGIIPKLSPEEKEERVKDKAMELADEYRTESSSAIKNIFSDLISCFAFVIILLTNKREIEVLKSFMGDLIYGLSDSAKAFIIILFTDMFVGFHSPHGWEVILEGISRHLGLPENHDFIFLFIATFPVILDAVFKYWIFRYLNRTSPSAVATYRNMNE
ncbi:MAG: proton extrusion protein PcxA [Actinomycetota bacterium]